MNILWQPWVLCWERPQGARPGTESEPRARDPRWCGHRGPCCARWFAAAPSQPQPAVPTSLSSCSEARQPGEIIPVLYCPMCILSLLEHRIRPTLTWIEPGVANSRRTARRRPCQLIAPNKNFILYGNVWHVWAHPQWIRVLLQNRQSCHGCINIYHTALSTCTNCHRQRTLALVVYDSWPWEQDIWPWPLAANHKAQPMLSSSTVFRGYTKSRTVSSLQQSIKH